MKNFINIESNWTESWMELNQVHVNRKWMENQWPCSALRHLHFPPKLRPQIHTVWLWKQIYVSTTWAVCVHTHTPTHTHRHAHLCTFKYIHTEEPHVQSPTWMLLSHRMVTLTTVMLLTGYSSYSVCNTVQDCKCVCVCVIMCETERELLKMSSPVETLDLITVQLLSD